MPHEIGSEECIPDSHCHWHDEDERSLPSYRICFECSHVYRSPEELQREWLENYPEDPEGKWGSPTLRPALAPPVDGIYFCPLCFHDF
jgi:hypothetical protein